MYAPLPTTTGSMRSDLNLMYAAEQRQERVGGSLAFGDSLEINCCVRSDHSGAAGHANLRDALRQFDVARCQVSIDLALRDHGRALVGPRQPSIVLDVAELALGATGSSAIKLLGRGTRWLLRLSDGYPYAQSYSNCEERDNGVGLY